MVHDLRRAAALDARERRPFDDARSAVGWGFVSLHHNLFAHSLRPQSAAWTCSPTISATTSSTISYGNGYGSDNDTRRLNYVGNTMKKGPDSTGNTAYAFSGSGPYWQYFAADNRVPADFKGVIEAEKVRSVVASHPVRPGDHPAGG